jgi:predicted nucleotidyltransferase
MTMNVSPVQTKQDAVRVIKTHGRAIRSLGVKRLGLFGSFMHDNQSLRATWIYWWILIPARKHSITILRFQCFLNKFLDVELNW